MKIEVRTWLVGLLDAIIVVYASSLAAVFLVGGIDAGWLSVTRAAKPILVLVIAVPLRLALPGRSWLVRAADRPWQYLAGRAPAPAPGAWWRSAAFRDVLFALVVTRVSLVALELMANLLFPARRLRPFAMPFRRERLAETFAAWDSGWYFEIASHGYSYSPDGQSSLAFFPLYPLLMRGLAWPFGGSPEAVWIAGVLISYAAFAGALLVLHRFTERMLGDRQAARRAVLYAAVFPFSFFLTKVYADGLFFLLSVLAVSRAYSGRWWEAGAWGALATLARPNGILVGVPLALMALRDRPPAAELLRRSVALAALAGGLIGYCAFAYALSGDPLAWLSAQAAWGYHLGRPPWEQLLALISALERYGLYDYFFTSPLAPFRLIHGAVGLLFLMLVPAIFVRLGPALGAYVLVSLLVPLSSNALEGIGRYGAVLFPVFMVMAGTRWPAVHEAVLIVSSLFLALFASLFVTWHPIY